MPETTDNQSATLGGTGEMSLSDQARSYLRLLDVLRKQAAAGAPQQLGLVASLARWLDIPPVLTLIAGTPTWYSEWDIKQALNANPHTPRRIREDIGHVVSIFELMRELDRPGLPDSEKAEIREDIKALFSTLTPEDKAVVRNRAHKLTSKSRPGGPPTPITMELPDVATLQAAVEYNEDALLELTAKLMSREPQSSVAASGRRTTGELLALPVPEQLTLLHDTSEAGFLQEALDSEREDVLETVFSNPALTEEIVLTAARERKKPVFFRVLARLDEWYQRKQVREALLENPNIPPDRQRGLILTNHIPKLFEAIAEGGEGAEAAKRVLDQVVDRLNSEDLIYALETAKIKYPDLADLMFSAPSFGGVDFGTATEPDQPGDVEPSAPTADGSVPVRDLTIPLENQPVSVRRFTAVKTDDILEIAGLMTDDDDSVFMALLDNPALSEDMLVGYTRTISGERAALIFNHPNRSNSKRIRDALLDNPNTPSEIGVRILNETKTLTTMLKVVKNPKVTAVEVKETALGKLVDSYRAMTSAERIEQIKNTRGEILTELADQAFHDDITIAALLQDPTLDKEIVLRIAKSRSASRSALIAVVNHPDWMEDSRIRLELVLNPKTPREAVGRLIPKLSPAERAKVRDNRNVPEHIRLLV